MKRKWIYLACLLAGVTAWNGAIAYGQTDVAASVDGAFSGTSQSRLEVQRSSNSAGGLLEVRHIHNALVGFEATYSYNRANQVYTYIGPPPPTTPCPSSGCNSQPAPVVIPANAHTLTGDWVISRKKRNLQYFALAGGGVLFVVPSNDPMYSSSTATEFVFECGIGLDWEFASHFGLRLQDRMDIDSAPNLNTFSTVNGDLTYTQEPALGVYYRF